MRTHPHTKLLALALSAALSMVCLAPIAIGNTKLVKAETILSVDLPTVVIVGRKSPDAAVVAQMQAAADNGS